VLDVDSSAQFIRPGVELIASAGGMSDVCDYIETGDV
jgi:hypothetical protein